MADIYTFNHVRTWVFDLDNTLYPPSARLFDQIEVRMTAYVMEALGVDEAEADHLRRKYWRDHGTTLAGLMREHDVDPAPYLTDVHDISLDHLEPDAELARAISDLPGRKIVYTNGCAPYAERVVEARGLSGQFDGVFGIEDADFHPKPDQRAYEIVFDKAELDPKRSAMFEDDPRNLAVPHQLGLRTIHVAPDPVDHDFIHHHTSALTMFLRRILAGA